MRMAHPRTAVLIGLTSIMLAGAVHSSSAQTVRRPQGWTDASHGPMTRPNYARIFALDKVHDIRITIPSARFAEMEADLKSIVPAGPPGFGPGRRGRPGGPGGFDPQQMAAMLEEAGKACQGKAENAACQTLGTDGVCAPMFGGPLACVPPGMANIARGGAIRLTTRDPMYVPVTITYDGLTWTNVAMRYKGNSSLASGSGKLPFRLDFSRNAKTDPSIAGQRFFGFGELTFSSNFTDDSQLREVLGAEIFRDRGIPAPRAAFYRVTVDAGDGPVYWGLYTAVEDPSDGAMLDAQLGSHTGNLYKPDGPGADWSRFDKAGFEKKNNDRMPDFRDVESAIAALHAPRTNPAAWRTTLETSFDVDLFLRWLAVNTAIDNWDTYGAMAHNYYLYANPQRGGRLQWIPWDNNMAFGLGPGGPGGPGRGGPRGGLFVGPPPGPPPAGPGGPGGPGGPRIVIAGFGRSTDVLHRDVGDQWPLIKILLADETYAAKYRQHLRDALGGLFAPDAFAKRARELHTLISASVVGPQGERPERTTVSSADAFERSVDGPGGLIENVTRRQTTIREALDPK